MKRWWLLLAHYSYIPLPRRWQAAAADVPRALVYLPLWGLLNGLLCWGAAYAARVLGSRWAAALLMGLSLAFNGGIWLRDVMGVADGRRPRRPPAPPGAGLTAGVLPPRAVAPEQPAGPRYNRAAWAVGGLYLALQYLCIWLLLYLRLPYALWPALALLARWVYLWGVYDFAALPPAFLSSGYRRPDFLLGSAFSLVFFTLCGYLTPFIWVAAAAALLAAALFYAARRRALGALDEAAYGAAAAWTEMVFLLVCIVCFQFF